MSDPQVESIPSQQENDKSDKFQIVSFEQVKNKCEVCQKKTTTGCSACRAVYYCSYEH
jgi:wobble nucleotide-excising tRNase